MFCAQCHSPNADDNKFCSECGDRLTASPSGESPEIVQLISKAFTYLEQGELAQAHSAIDAALALSPESSTAHSVRSILFEREGRMPEAIRELELVVAKNPNSTTDRAKLEALRGNAPTRGSRKRWSSQQITFASAAAAGLVVFGAGLAVISQSQPARHNSQPSSSANLQAVSSTLPGTTTTGPVAPRSLPSLPTTPMAPKALQGPPVPSPVRAALGKAPAPVITAPGRPSFLRPSSPIGPMGMPPLGAAGGPTRNAGLPPAAIGEVVPLPQAPATAPGGPAVAAVNPPGVPGSNPAPGTPGASPAPEAPKPVESVEPRTRVEPLEPETGFIKIEPLKAAGEGKGTAPASAKSAAPSISVNIASSGGDEAAIAEAQRAQRNAFNAARLANVEDAERHYRQAANLYELLVKRGGSSARQAREGLEACRKALAALR